MTLLDRALQQWRIHKAAKYLKAGDSVLDIGCAIGTLFRQGRYSNDQLATLSEQTSTATDQREVLVWRYVLIIASKIRLRTFSVRMVSNRSRIIVFSWG
jgi:hypothetical protein